VALSADLTAQRPIAAIYSGTVKLDDLGQAFEVGSGVNVSAEALAAD
jgi:hypothetical protein